MVTEAKKEEVVKFREYFMESKSAVFVDYRGVTAEEMTAVRKQLREAESHLQVVKNTLARLAAKDTPFECAESLFSGPLSVAFGFGEDVSAPAKALVEFAKRVENLHITGGVLEGRVLDEAQVRVLASTPPKPVVQAMLLGTFQAPARNFMGVLEGVARKFLFVLTAYAEKKKEA
ncbi:MAG TPA: 50S ribosomal protein L10 [Nitrospirae bacterium]|nr:50S ribosomal protein L10 [Nitrospirota bacterium]